VRFAAQERCPRCSGQTLFDLRDRKARRDALRALKVAGASGSIRIDRIGAGYIRYVIPAVAGLVFLYGAITQSVLAALIMTFIAVWALLAGLLMFVGAAYLLWLVWRFVVVAVRLLLPGTRKAPAHRRIITTDEHEVGPGAELVEARGAVRVKSPVPSPLRHRPCAAFRLIGQGPLGDIDDAGGVPFEVVLDGGQRVQVDPTHASIAIEVDEEAAVVRPDQELARFLERRGVFPDRGPVRVAEAVLRDGDRVVVEGACDLLTEADSYRVARPIPVFRERPGAPLVIRRP
jgi:hypothetical protein